MRVGFGFLGWIVLGLALACGLPLCAQDLPEQDPLWREAELAHDADALPHWRKLAEKYPQAESVWYRLGRALYDSAEYEEALGALRKSAERGHTPADIQHRLGRTLAKLKRHAEAEQAFREALKHDADLVAAQFGLASAQYNQDRAAEALPAFKALAEREDDWGASAREFVAHCYYDTGQFFEAADAWSRLAEALPDDPYRRWMLARSLYKAKRYAEALPHLKFVREKSSARADAARYYEAACLEGLGRSREAESAYADLSRGGSGEWSVEAAKAADRIAGRPFRLYLDVLEGFDTGIIATGDESAVLNERDTFTQVYALGEGRLLRRERFEFWVGGEHFGLHYPRVHDNDYFEDTGTISLRFLQAGPFRTVELKYGFKYAQFDYQPYSREHFVEASAEYRSGPHRLRFGATYGEPDYFRESEGLTGTRARVFWDWRRTLPLWDHELRLRGNLDCRWSQADVSQRFTQRVRLMYRAKIWRDLYGQLEGTYRRDDYPESQSATAPQRTDQRLRGEARLDYQLWKHFSFNWGYTYEAQDSTRSDQEYGRHQIDAGFTFNF